MALSITFIVFDGILPSFSWDNAKSIAETTGEENTAIYSTDYHFLGFMRTR
jgi:hypothetical protein